MNPKGMKYSVREKSPRQFERTVEEYLSEQRLKNWGVGELLNKHGPPVWALVKAVEVEMQRARLDAGRSS